jgi:hypothetical protein
MENIRQNEIFLENRIESIIKYLKIKIFFILNILKFYFILLISFLFWYYFFNNLIYIYKYIFFSLFIYVFIYFFLNDD